MLKSRSSKTILLLEPDDEVRPLLKETLQLQGYHVVLALDIADAIERIQTIDLDLILLNQVGQSLETSVNTGQQIRQNAVSAQIPIIVIAEQYESDLEGTNVQLGENEYVTYLEDVQQLIDLLHELCG